MVQEQKPLHVVLARDSHSWRRFARRVALIVASIALGTATAQVVALTSYEPVDFSFPAPLLKVMREARALLTPTVPLNVPEPTKGTETLPFDSPWLAEKEFGNSQRAANPSSGLAAGSDAGALADNVTLAEGPTTESALQNGTVAMLAGLPTIAGRIPSTFAVTQTGTANYMIPIWTPPGARGIEPKLALVYASGSPDSLMGPGWSIGGLSTISRCIKTWAQDGTPGPIALASTDKFCLDGNRLRLTGGTYGADSSTYQTELEIFSQVIAHGVAGNGPQWFEVKGKDGFIYEYGNTTDSRVLGAGASTPYLWALNKIRDRQNNNLTVSYLQTSGSFRPDIISYTQTPATSTVYNYRVQFNYVTRAAAANLTKYIGGAKVQQTMVLSGISVQTTMPSIATVRQYNIDYATAPATQRPRVSAVQTCTATDCLKPTTIAYQDGQAGVAAPTTTASTGATTGRMNTVDLDGDGKQDLIYAVTSGANQLWYAKFATATGFGAAISTGVTTASNDAVLFDDFLAEGRTSVLVPINSTWYLLRWNGSAFTTTTINLPVVSDTLAPNTRFATADVDGDGRPDLVSYHNNAIYSRLNTGSGGSMAFAATETIAFGIGSGVLMGLYGNNSYPASPVRRMDFNGDGRDDIVATVFNAANQVPVSNYLLLSSATAFTFTGNTGGAPVLFASRFNDDDCTDVVIAGFVFVWGCGTAPGATVIYSGTAVMAADWDGDGRNDLWVNSGSTVYRSYGESISAGIATGITSGTGTYQVFDHNADGLDDIAFANSGSSYAISYGRHNGAGTLPDLATSFTDGYEMNTSFSYAAMTASNSCYVRDSASPAFPARALVAPIYTACTLSASSGNGSTYSVTHTYYNLNVDLQGRGLLGFERRYAVDSRNGILEMESYGQSFPYIGMKLADLVRQPNGTTKIREIANTPSALSLGTGFESRRFPYISQSVDDSYEVGGALNGQWITRTTTTSIVDSFGNPTTLTASTIDKSSASPWFGETFTTQSTHTITNNTTNWCLGHPTQTTVTSTLPDSTSQTRTSSATVDYTACRTTQEIVEPSSTTLKVTTTYGFDTCGNVNSVSIVGKNPDGTDMAARTTTTSYGTRCQFPVSVTNPLSQTSTAAYDYSLGVPSSKTDPNGISSSWTYDGYGRKKQETRPDGTTSIYSYYICDAGNSYCGVPDVRVSVYRNDYATNASLLKSEGFYWDGLERVRYDQSTHAFGLVYDAIIGYDNSGRRIWQYQPVTSGSNGYESWTYDLIGRSVTDALYNGSGVLDRQTTLGYEGRNAILTDAKGNVTSKLIDVRGKLRQVVDPSPGGTTTYTWDHFGNLLTTMDPIGAGSSSTYDLRGFKRTSFDPDAGSWSYTPNSLGEYVSQTDAKNQTTTWAYDKLGRMTSRTEAEGTSTWTWGTTATAHNIGKLASVSGPSYSESYTYDSIGRPLTTTYNADVGYQVDYAYDAITGYLDNVTYPTSTAGYRLRAQYLYQYGAVVQVRDYNATSTVWWTLNAEDDRGNPVDEQFGNGVHVLANNDGLTGHLNWRMSGNNTQFNNHQNITYQWDKNENLTDRIDVNQANLTEHFIYDAMDRLDRSTLNGTTNLDVTLDAAGNIINKTGTSDVQIGTYSYDPIKRHAVKTTSNGWSFTYDSNGNMLTGRGSTYTWYSYNLPNSITQGSLSSQFFYTPNRKYWKQVANYVDGPSTTIYVGGLLEKVTNAVGTEYRHMIAAGSASILVSRSTAGSNNTYYATQDSLGSSSVITNSSGAVVVKQSFGAYGNRRGGTWQGSPSSADWAGIASTTRQGYTGHTMVDNVTLIHMNGRMYDPLLGRFLSPDPFVQSIAESQSVNPYSYCWNNPLKYVDPSGFGLFSRIWKGIKSVVHKVVNAIVNVVKQIVIDFIIDVVAAYVCGPYAAACAQIVDVALGAANTRRGGGPSYGQSGDWGSGVSSTSPNFGVGGGGFDGGTDARADLARLERQGAILSEAPTSSAGDMADHVYRPASLYDFWLGANEEIALSYGADSWQSAFWNFFAGGWVDVSRSANEGRYAAAAGGVILAITPVGRVAKRGAQVARGLKAINLPAWRKVGIDMAHVAERHTANGALSAGRTTFPELMNEKGIERAIREAYRYGDKIGSQGDRVLMRGSSDGLTIEMWVNRATETIETAYPVFP